MKIEIVSIDSVHPDPANARKHSERNLAVVAASLKRFRQQKPIVVDRDNVVRAGNATFAAAKSLGWAEIKIVRTELTGPELAAYAIADNRAGDPEVGSSWDTRTLADLVGALKAEDAALALVTGFNQEEIDSLMGQRLEDLPTDFAKEFDEKTADGIKTVKCPHCGKEFPL